jgi:hypothetical protein
MTYDIHIKSARHYSYTVVGQRKIKKTSDFTHDDVLLLCIIITVIYNLEFSDF